MCWTEVLERKLAIDRVSVVQSNGRDSDVILETTVFLVAEKISALEARDLPRGIAVEALVDDQLSTGASEKAEKQTDRLGITRPTRILTYKLIAPSGEILFDGVAQEQGTPRYVVAQGDRPKLHWQVGIQVSPAVQAAVAAHVRTPSGVRLTIDGTIQTDMFDRPGKTTGTSPETPGAEAVARGATPKRPVGRPPLSDEVKAARAAKKQSQSAKAAAKRGAALASH